MGDLFNGNARRAMAQHLTNEEMAEWDLAADTLFKLRQVHNARRDTKQNMRRLAARAERPK